MTSDRDNRKAAAVREMFSRIAGRYDLLNHLLSLNIDRTWRRACVRTLRPLLPGTGARILDVGCGTGDLALEFSRLGTVVGCDFSLPMLDLARRKTARRRELQSVHVLGADALSLPFRNGEFDAVVSAFVLRNLANAGRGLGDMRRVLKRGGALGVLDFGIPGAPLVRSVYRFYFTRVLPAVGSAMSGVRGPYQYLPSSVEAFSPPGELCRLAREVGFKQVSYRPLSLGIAFLLTGIAGD